MGFDPGGMLMRHLREEIKCAEGDQRIFVGGQGGDLRDVAVVLAEQYERTFHTGGRSSGAAREQRAKMAHLCAVYFRAAPSGIFGPIGPGSGWPWR